MFILWSQISKWQITAELLQVIDVDKNLNLKTFRNCEKVFGESED